MILGSYEVTTDVMQFLMRPVGGVFIVLLIVSALGCTSRGQEESTDEAPEDVELAQQMATLQRWTHKTVLALDAKNAELGEFYLHEVEETLERIEDDVPTYEGHQIAELTEQMLVPSVEALDRAVDDGAWPTVERRVQELAQSCNRCHRETDHGFVRIDLQDVPNPYPQSFAPAK